MSGLGRKLSPRPDSTSDRLATMSCQSFGIGRMCVLRRSKIAHAHLEWQGKAARIAVSKVGESWRFPTKYSSKQQEADAAVVYRPNHGRECGRMFWFMRNRLVGS